MDGFKAGLGLVSLIGTTRLAINLLPATRNRVANRLAGNVLDQQPTGEKQGEINNGEEQHQQDRNCQREFDHTLRMAGTPKETFSVPGNSKLWSPHSHSPNAPAGWQYCHRSF
jgi:hypothetical protein